LSDKIKLGRQNSKKQMWIGDPEDITSDFININLLWLKDGEAREIKKQGSEEVEYLILKVKNEIKAWGEFFIKEANK
jgi:hypothetical protein